MKIVHYIPGLFLIATPRLAELGSRRLSDSPSFLFNIQKPTWRVRETFFDYKYLLEFEAKIETARKIV